MLKISLELVALFPLLFSPAVRGNEALEEVLNSTFFNYDKNIRPFYGERPVDVGVTIHILSISKVDTSHQEFTMDFYFRQSWTDTRLHFQPKPLVTDMTLEADYMRRFWVPDTFFVNEVTSTFHSTSVSNELVRLKANGDVTKSMRLTVTASCPMDLKNFPFDSPACILHIESFSGGVQDMRYEWISSPSVTVGPAATISDFTLEGYKLDSSVIESLPPVVGNYSRLTLHLQLRRIFGRYQTDFYSPSFLIVLLALSSLWVGDQRWSIALATVNLIALLCLSFINSAELKLPKWAETNWLDSYTKLGSTFIIFVIVANLLELNLPEFLASNENHEQEEVELKVESSKKNRSLSVSAEDAKLVRASNPVIPSINDPGKVLVLKSKLHFWTQRALQYYHRFKGYLKYVLLVVFLLSNLIYWKTVPDFMPMQGLIRV